MSDIKNKLIKIAYENPKLRDELLPIIMKEAVFGGIVNKVKDLATGNGKALRESLKHEFGHPPNTTDPFYQNLFHNLEDVKQALSVGWDEVSRDQKKMESFKNRILGPLKGLEKTYYEILNRFKNSINSVKQSKQHHGAAETKEADQLISIYEKGLERMKTYEEFKTASAVSHYKPLLSHTPPDKLFDGPTRVQGELMVDACTDLIQAYTNLKTVSYEIDAERFKATQSWR